MCVWCMAPHRLCPAVLRFTSCTIQYLRFAQLTAIGCWICLVAYTSNLVNTSFGVGEASRKPIWDQRQWRCGAPAAGAGGGGGGGGQIYI